MIYFNKITAVRRYEKFNKFDVQKAVKTYLPFPNKANSY